MFARRRSQLLLEASRWKICGKRFSRRFGVQGLTGNVEPRRHRIAPLTATRRLSYRRRVDRPTSSGKVSSVCPAHRAAHPISNIACQIPVHRVVSHSKSCVSQGASHGSKGASDLQHKIDAKGLIAADKPDNMLGFQSDLRVRKSRYRSEVFSERIARTGSNQITAEPQRHAEDARGILFWISQAERDSCCQSASFGSAEP